MYISRVNLRGKFLSALIALITKERAGFLLMPLLVVEAVDDDNNLGFYDLRTNLRTPC